MALDPSSEDINSTERIGFTNPVGSDQKKMMNPGESTFQSYMEQSPAGKPAQASPLASPFDLPQHSNALTSTPTYDTLMNQAKAAQVTLADMNSQMNTPNLKLKQSSKYLLRNKLSDANAHLRTANAKLGAEMPEASTPPSGPLGKFIGMITDGQNQLQAAQQQIKGLKDKGEHMSPADLLLVQVKLNMAQQELEYSSVVLSKAVDDIKMLFNINL